MTLQWTTQGTATIVSEGFFKITSGLKSGVFSQVLGDESFSISFKTSNLAMFGICSSDVIGYQGTLHSNPKTRLLYQSNGTLYPSKKEVGLQGSWEESDILKFEYDANIKKISVYKNGILKATPFADLEKEPFHLLFSTGTSSSGVTCTIIEFSFLTKSKFLLQNGDFLYTVYDDIINLGSIATADKMALFASDGFETLTKANCETIAEQLGKCKILRADV